MIRQLNRSLRSPKEINSMQKVHNILLLIIAVLLMVTALLFFSKYAREYGVAAWHWIVFLLTVGYGLITIVKIGRNL